MIRTKLVMLLAASMAPLALVGKEHIIEVSRNDLRAYQQTIAVPKGKFKELCVALKMGDAYEWSFTSSAETDFNVHYHKGKETVFPAKSAGVREAAGTLRAELDEHYCWMWKAAAGDATIDVRVGAR